MKKLLLSGAVAVLLIPGLTFAAYNDVSLTTDADISVNSITLDVSGTTAAVESIEIGSTSFTAIFQASSYLKVSAPGLNQLSYDVLNAANQSSNVDYVCTGSAATLTITAVASTTVIVTPLSSVCSDPVAASSGRSSRGDARNAPVVAVVSPAVAQTPALAVTAANPSRVILNTDLSTGVKSDNVRTLQQFLNTHGFAVASSGPGSPGNETDFFGNLTTKAVQKFQEEYDIVSSGTPSTTGYGRVGPKTRAKINELSGN